MRILLVGNFLSAKGKNRGVSEDLACRLSANGWAVVTTSSYTYGLLRLLDMLYTTWCRRLEYDVAHIDVFSGNAFYWSEAVAYSLRLLKKPIVLTLRGGNLPIFAKRRPIRMNRLLNLATTVTAPSNYLLEAMQQFRNDVILLSNPLDLDKYPFRLRSNPQPKLVWLRAFHKIYRPELTLFVLKELFHNHPNAFLNMIGPDKGDGSLQKVLAIVEELTINQSVQFSGKIPKNEVAKWMNTGDIFLNTSDVDNTPISVIEAMACGLCIISTNVGGIPYLLDHEHNALLVPPNNPSAMVKAVNRVLTEEGLAEKLSRNARVKSEQFDWSIILPKWKSLFEDVANN